MSKHP